MKYILFECLNCGTLQAINERKGEGRNCIRCKGHIVPTGKYTREELKEMIAGGGVGRHEVIIRDDIEHKIKMCETINEDLICRIGTGLKLLKAFEWRHQGTHINIESILSYDRATGIISIKEEDLMGVIKLANPGQPERTITLT